MNSIRRLFSSLSVVALFCWSGPLFAEYTLLLKNGRRITVQSYREEGGMIKFYGFGGEIGITKDQIQSIVKAGVSVEGRGVVLSGDEDSRALPTEASQGEKEMAGPGSAEEAQDKKSSAEAKEKTPEEQLAEEKAKEEKEYQGRLKELTEQIKEVKDRYSTTTRGSSSSEPSLLNTEEAIRARQEDLNSRLRDAQYNPAGPSDADGVNLKTHSPFTGAPPTIIEQLPGGVAPPRVDTPLPDYTARERELSDLRNQMNQLQNERERLIQEMKQKNLDTGSLFLE
ncbi:MAG: hypothetical protein ACREQA_17925 [Candidatus Binatia bacterium]